MGLYVLRSERSEQAVPLASGRREASRVGLSAGMLSGMPSMPPRSRSAYG